MTAIKAPFPIETYFGGKSRIAPQVWDRLGDVPRYVEPFAGSLAVLLARPQPFTGREIVNDSDGLLVNTWRAMASDPEAPWPRGPTGPRRRMTCTPATRGSWASARTSPVGWKATRTTSTRR